MLINRRLGGSKSIKWILLRNSLVVQWVGLHAVTAKRDMSLLTSKDRQDCPESQKTQRETEIFKRRVYMTCGDS